MEFNINKLLLIFFFLINVNASVITLKEDNRYKISTKDIKVYKDETKNYSINEILSRVFSDIKNDRLNFKYSGNTYWLKFDIKRTTKESYYLKLNNTWLNEVNIYYVKNKEVLKEYKTGLKYNHHSKAISSNEFAFPLDLYLDSYTIYLKINSANPILLPLEIVKENYFLKEQNFNTIFDTVFYACVILMFFYNLFIYIISKVQIFKFYLSYIVGIIGFLLYYDGYLLSLVFYDTALLNELFSYLFFIMIFISISVFSSILFQSKKYANVLHNILISSSIYIMPLLCLLAMLLVYFNLLTYLYLVHKSIIVTSIFILLLIVSITIRQFVINRVIVSKVYAFIWVIFMLVTMFYIMNFVLGIVDIQLMTKILKLNIVLEVVMMSLLIAYKLKISNEENLKLELKNKEQELYILRQTRLASFGEVLNSIIHEWKQPLHRINMISLDLEITYNKKGLTKEYLYHQLNEIETQTKYMNDTVTQFSDYFNPKKEKEKFYLIDCVKEAIKLLSVKFNKNSVNYLINCTDNKISTSGYKKEYIQVIIILLNNSIDAIVKENIQNPTIVFEIFQRDNIPMLCVIDNAGGIKVKPIDKIFDANVSTKDEKVNSGIGLFIAKRIIEDNTNKKLICQNHYDGAKFSIIG